MTGQATIDSAVEATNRGAFSYLVKPYEIDQLINHIRRALEKQRAEEEIAEHHIELERMNAELKTLHEISEAISHTLDMDELVKDVLQVMLRTRIFPFEVCGGVFLLNDDRLCLTSFVSLPETPMKPCKEIRHEQCLCGRALATGKVLISRDARNGTQALCHPETERYERIIVPLKAIDKVVGLISLYTEPGTEVSEGLMSLLSSLGNQIGIAVNNARLYEELKSISLHDPLTGLANRRFLAIQLEKVFEPGVTARIRRSSCRCRRIGQGVPGDHRHGDRGLPAGAVRFHRFLRRHPPQGEGGPGRRADKPEPGGMRPAGKRDGQRRDTGGAPGQGGSVPDEAGASQPHHQCGAGDAGGGDAADRRAPGKGTCFTVKLPVDEGVR